MSDAIEEDEVDSEAELDAVFDDDETTDDVVEDPTEEPATEAAEPAAEFDYQKGYAELRPEYTRATQEAADLRRKLAAYEAAEEDDEDDEPQQQASINFGGFGVGEPQDMEQLGQFAESNPEGAAMWALRKQSEGGIDEVTVGRVFDYWAQREPTKHALFIQNYIAGQQAERLRQEFEQRIATLQPAQNYVSQQTVTTAHQQFQQMLDDRFPPVDGQPSEYERYRQPVAKLIAETPDLAQQINDTTTPAELAQLLTNAYLHLRSREWFDQQQAVAPNGNGAPAVAPATPRHVTQTRSSAGRGAPAKSDQAAMDEIFEGGLAR